MAATGTNPPPRLTVEDRALDRDVKSRTSIAPVVKRVSPSVVNIYSSMTIKERRTMNPFFSDPFFRDFFGDDSEGRRAPREHKAQSLGSGVIVSQDGYILTANHVVEGADTVKVALSAGDKEKEYDAKIIGTDPPTDIAVLRIEAKGNLPAAVLGDSDKLEVGDLVIALGNPFSVGQTVTMGIVSALGRGGFGISGYEDFIQTDAAINPGNSGGALVDAEGRLVGINTAIMSRSGGFQGVGFAVPINMARFVMERLIRDGKVARGYLGINIQPLTADLAKEFGLPDESSGVLVGGVSTGSAAEKAGLKEGDVILEFNGKKVPTPRNLQLLVAEAGPKTKATLKILRSEGGGKPIQKQLSATLDELPRELSAGRRSIQSEPGESKLDALDGVEVGDLDNRARRQFEVPQSVQGALVTRVDPNSNAAAAGLRPGDVIVQINRQPVRSAEDAVNLSEKAKSERLLLLVWSRGAAGGPGGTRYIVVDNTKK